jgi:hypothetical protein
MGGLVGFALAHLRGDWRRSLAAGAAILVAVASFVVLTGTVTSQQLQVTQEVHSNYRSTYDILVRPRGSANLLERSDGVVRPNFLSGSYGGITLAQVGQIGHVPGVEVAAPVAVVGQMMSSVLLTVDVRGVLGSREHVLLRFGLNGAARNGTAHTTNQQGFLYLTRNTLATIDTKTGSSSGTPAQIEHRASGKITACLASNAGGGPKSPATEFDEFCWSSRSDGDTNPRVEALLTVPLTIQAIDPDAEARLTGLGQAMVDGRSLAEDDSYGTDNSGPAPVDAATAVMASTSTVDFQATLEVEELSDSTTEQVLATKDADARRKLVLAAKPVRTVERVVRDAAEAYDKDIVDKADTASGGTSQGLIVNGLVQPGDVSFTGSEPMTPQVVAFDPNAWKSSTDSDGFDPAPSSITDSGYRSVTRQSRTGDSFVSFRVVGTYDPDKLPKPSELNEVPLETYRTSYVEGADEASRKALGDKPMLSDLSPTGYVQSPPALLVPIKSLPLFWRNFPGLNQSAPVSSVRVRVADINGLDPVARERMRQIAEQIHEETGLDVDITIGASLQNRQVALPETLAGTPALLLNERWTKKGVAVAITDALDVKSLVLFLLILASSALTIALIATATVRARRRELATLSCLGWNPGRLRAATAVELAMVGLGAGTVGAVVAVPLAHLLDIGVPLWQAALAVPLGALLALLPGTAATATAARIAPIEAFRLPVRRGLLDGRLTLRGGISLGLILTLRRPGRALVASLAVALGVASAVTLAGLVTVFNGAVVGSFLGDAVALRVRAPDIAAAVILTLLGLTAVVTVLLLALFEDAAGYAALQATGWTDRMLSSSLITHAAVIGILGTILGGAAALWLTATVLGPLSAAIWAAAGSISAAAVLLCVLAGVLPGLAASRLPAARILARE